MYRTLKSPISAQIEITEHCNWRCIHCYNYWRTQEARSYTTLTIEEVEKIVTELADNEVFDLTFTGGEPLLFPEQVLAGATIAKKRGMWIGLNSNLTHLTHRLAHDLKSVGFKSVLVSLCGPTPEIHEQISGREGSFKEGTRGILIALEAGLKVFVNMVTTRANQDYAYETGAYVAGLGASGFSVTRATAPGNCPNFEEDFQISREKIKEHMEILLQLELDFGYNVSVCECHPLCLIGDVKRFRHISRRGCNAGISTLAIGSKGEVRPCTHVGNSYGNILVEGLHASWLRMIEWRDGSLVPETCSLCKYFPICTGGCRMEGKNSKGSLNGMDTHATGPEDVVPPEDGWISPDRDISGYWVVNPTARLRTEDFGGIIKVTDGGRIPLNKDSYQLLTKLCERRAFTFEDVGKEFSFNPQSESSYQFLQIMLKRSIFMRP
ncbi:hypothetical protein COV24_02730 [candidate division WWE3 bacterium CG10_big_fil_rev_8_21_14_0_10_32_10]|uniref:Radical SAM core domain-containing protein n=1 Tax=candidate division WWE3 bacterium CG10_big_fil_rev_8_21_14_0_10_32_10 TaxID=1975090 RepID=A0A2H0RA71_UNCKA|nr:MAG: hypothetical protein COV24_02730 [candidate division WWE3 bacterium CG10_big_fil_rev_8_21_14_0_10_32_10]